MYKQLLKETLNESKTGEEAKKGYFKKDGKKSRIIYK